MLQMCPRALALIQGYSKALPGSPSTHTCQVRQLPHALHRVLSKRRAESTFWDSLLPRGSGLSQRVAFCLAPVVEHSCHFLMLSASQGVDSPQPTLTHPLRRPPPAALGCVTCRLACNTLPIAADLAAMHAGGAKMVCTCKEICKLQYGEDLHVVMQCLA